MQQAMRYSFVLVLPFTLLSGLTTPISSMPGALRMTTLINPLRYAIDIARCLLGGRGACAAGRSPPSAHAESNRSDEAASSPTALPGQAA
jgi:hypothetical protein